MGASGVSGNSLDASRSAFCTMSTILCSGDCLRHISSEWASRTEIAIQLSLHVDTVARHFRAARCRERIVVNARHKAELQFYVDDVRQALGNRGRGG